MFGIDALQAQVAQMDARLRKVEKEMAGVAAHLERTQNEWRQTREEIIIQMDEIRHILRPDEPR